MPNLALSAKRRRALRDRAVPIFALTLIAASIGAHAAPHDNDGDSRFAPGFVPGPGRQPQRVRQRVGQRPARRDPAAELREDHRWLRRGIRRAERRHLSDRVEQRPLRRQLRHHVAHLPRPDHAGRRCRQHARSAEQPAERLRARPAGDELQLEVGARPAPVARRPLSDVHGLRRAGQYGRRVELEHAARGRYDQPGWAELLSRDRARRSPRAFPLHRDERVQRQQRPRGDPEQSRRPRDLLHVGQRRQRREPAAGQRDPRRGRAAHRRREASRSAAGSGRADAARELRSRNSARRPTRSARTTTSAASRCTTTSCTTRRAAVATA